MLRISIMAALIGVLALFGMQGLPAANATPGDLLLTVTEPEPASSCCGIGIEYDGTKVLYTHYLDNRIHFTDLTGTDLGDLPLLNPDLSPYTGDCCNAIAINFDDGFLYAGGWASTNLYKVDLTTGIVTLVKASAVPVAFGFIDGLAWDPRDNTFWMSDDVQCNVEHLDALGNDIGGFDGCAVTGLANSGLTVGVDGTLFYGTNGAGQIFSLDTTTNPPTNNGQFASPGGRDEDMACGPRFTKRDGSEVETLLSQDAHNNTFVVIEMADGQCVSPAEAGCPQCDKTEITVDEDVTVDLNPAVPTCNDGATDDLCDYFSYDKTGSDASQWKAIFTVGDSKLVIKDNATVTTVPVPYAGNNRKAPGIEIVGNCELFIEGDLDNNGEPGGIVVSSINQPGGDIKVQIGGNVEIDGHVRNQVLGTNGTPGDITIASCCGDITTGPRSRIETIGVDHGGGDINIVTCCDGDGGDITINGLVRAIHKQGKPPTINIVSLLGAVTIDGRNNFGEEVEAGTLVRRMSGVLVKTTGATVAGDINIQAHNNVTVYGNTIINKNRVQYGAVAIKSHNTNGQGGDGDMTIISTDGGIRALDRAFDFENRFNALNAISLSAHNDINLAVSAAINNGAVDNAKGVVSSQGGQAGKGGSNSLRAYSGQISIGAKAGVLANAPGGANGSNSLTSCLGVNNLGTVNPADLNNADDAGVCAPAGPAPLFVSCEEFGLTCGHVDAIIDADGFASPQSGDPGAREVAHGDPLSNFGTVTGARCGLDWFDQDASGEWSNGDDLHCESTQCQQIDPRGATHDVGYDCVVLDVNGDLADGDQVDCDMDIMLPFTGACPSAILKYHDANTNGQYDNGEDIVLDTNLDGVFN